LRDIFFQLELAKIVNQLFLQPVILLTQKSLTLFEPEIIIDSEKMKKLYPSLGKE